MSSYMKGRRFEYRVRDLFKKQGYVVIRAARSKPVDLVCLKDGRVFLIECKTRKTDLGKTEREKLLDIAMASKTIPILAYKERRKVKLLNIRTNSVFSLPHDK